MRRLARHSATIGLLCCSICWPPVAQGAVETVLYSFQNNGTDGQAPEAALLDLNGTFYGTTIGGGAYGFGTIFSLNPKTGAEAIAYSFQNDGTDGNIPISGLLNVEGTLYGTTQAGGAGNCQSVCGTVFSFDPATGAESVVYSFCSLENCSDGGFPTDQLIAVKNKLFGTTSLGGTNQECNLGCGTVFLVDPATGSESVLYSFCAQQACADGSNPQGGLLIINGKLYGTTQTGGAYGGGTVFSIDSRSGTESVVHSFQVGKADGTGPSGDLTYVNGLIYGTTSGGGKHYDGTVYSIDPSTGDESILYSFCIRRGCKDGFSPLSGVIYKNGNLYGTTLWGGNFGCGYGCGIVFSLDPQTGAEKVLYSFCRDAGCADGGSPVGDLLYTDGKLYGVTEQGGTGTCNQFLIGCGTVFRIKP